MARELERISKGKAVAQARRYAGIGSEEFEPSITRIRAQGVTTKRTCSVLQTYILPVLSHFFFYIISKGLK